MVLARIIIFPIVPNMVWEGIVLGTILEKVKPRENLIRSMWICDGPGKGHHFSHFSQYDLVRNVLGTIFGKSEAKRKTLSGICGFVMVLARLTIPPTFPNMVW